MQADAAVKDYMLLIDAKSIRRSFKQQTVPVCDHL